MKWGTPWEIRREKRRSIHGDKWFSWFAWKPVRLEDDTWIWLDRVEKRYPWGFMFDPPDYRSIDPAPSSEER